MKRMVGLHGLTVTLYHADCLDVLPLEADAVISDPPYGMDWNTDSTRFSGGQSENIRRKPRGEGRGRQSQYGDYGPVGGDCEPFDPAPWIEYPRCVLFGANHYAQRLPVGTTLVWLKKDQHLWGTFLSDAELAWMKGGHGVYAYLKSFPPPVRAVDAGGNPCRPVGIHPTQKPVSLMAWCMDRAKVPRGATVLDPYMGSGTTGIACLRTGRNFIGIERDAAHYKTACDRLAHELDSALL